MAAVNLAYTPRPHFRRLHKRPNRFALMVCHRRAGKTFACVNELVVRALYTNKKNARYAYIAPFYRQAKDVAWQYLKEATKEFALETRESDLRIVLPNGAWITLYGADNPDALRGIYLDGLILDEYGDCRPSLWGEVLLPTLLDRKGWAIFIGTPKGKNHFYKLHLLAAADPTWYHMILKASESGILSADDLKLARDLSDEAKYRQEFECDFTAAVKGTYYADRIDIMEKAGHIAPYPHIYDPTLSVYAATDIGKSDSTAMWFFQEDPDDDRYPVRVINYREAQGKEISDWVEYMNNLVYPLEKVWFPKDAKAETFQSTRSTIQQFVDAGFNCHIVPSLSKQHGIDAVRQLLTFCKFDSIGCDEGIEALRAYRRVYDEKLDMFRDEPLHDWASDGADAFRYLAMVAHRPAAPAPPELQPNEPGTVPITLDGLWEAHDNAPVLSLLKQRI